MLSVIAGDGARVRLVCPCAIVRSVRFIGAVMGERQFVVANLQKATTGDGEQTDQPRPLCAQIVLQMSVEQLVVAELVSGDAMADGLQHRLLSRVAQRGVERTGPAFDDAAGDQLTRTRASYRGRRVH